MYMTFISVCCQNIGVFSLQDVYKRQEIVTEEILSSGIGKKYLDTIIKRLAGLYTNREDIVNRFALLSGIVAVSYTHLDVYKRQHTQTVMQKILLKQHLNTFFDHLDRIIMWERLLIICM